MTPDPLFQDARAVARAMTLVENDAPEAEGLLARIHPHTGRAFLIGITGPPGSGKSTLVDRLITLARQRGLRVGVLAVDPTSPFTGGAVLGDRVRMGSHATDAGVFIRSMATRGHPGGLARATADCAAILDAAGMDLVIIETVGVGQDEVDIVRTADVTVVVLVPGTGDDVQAVKAGVMEIGDIFVINKADREGAERAADAVRAMLALAPVEPGAWRPPVLLTQAHTGTGVAVLRDAIDACHHHPGSLRPGRARERQRLRLRSILRDRFLARVDEVLARDGDALLDRVMARELAPRAAADDVMRRLGPGAAATPDGDAASPLEPGSAAHALPLFHHADLRVRTLRWGAFELTFLHDGPFRLDGGAMFGIVPRVLWEQKTRADERHRIQLAMRPLLVQGRMGRVLIDCGAGDKIPAKAQDIYGMDRRRTLDAALREAGLGREDIDLVVATHLHFDHIGGATMRDRGTLHPRFPRARHHVRRGEWDDATHPHERNRASYLQDDFVPLLEAGLVDFHDADVEIVPGVRVVRTGGHTAHHEVVFIESEGRTAVFVADLIPTTAHLQDAWVMGYDLFPADTVAFKKRFIREAIDREYLIVFEHDPLVAAGYIRERDGRRFVEPVA
jgi:LAO/AO transport system kinase